MVSPKQKRTANSLPAERVNVWDALRAELNPERPPNSITVREWMDLYSVTEGKAYKELTRLERLGRVTKTTAPVNGHLVCIFVPKE